MRIVSRENEDQIQHDRICEIIEIITDGNITPANTLAGLISQVEDAVLHLVEHNEKLEESYTQLKFATAGLNAHCSKQEQQLANLLNISFDEALDNATVDLMDAFLGSGAANTTYSGNISFDPSVTFSKQDLKPLLRQAIITWITEKIS